MQIEFEVAMTEQPTQPSGHLISWGEWWARRGEGSADTTVKIDENASEMSWIGLESAMPALFGFPQYACMR